MSHLLLPVNASDHHRGSLNSPLMLLFYADYQCPVCKLTNQILNQLKAEYGERLCLIFRHFPLQKSHPLAKSAALAAEAASKQNQFWEMHDLLYQNQHALSPELYLQLAEKLHLNLSQFQKECASETLAKKIQDDFEGGVRSGVNGTPCFFIHGERYDGDATYEGLKKTLG